MKILLAIDGSKYSDAAVEEVARRAWPVNTQVKLISVTDPPYTPAIEPWAVAPSYIDEFELAARGRTQAIIESAIEQLRTQLDPTFEVSVETPVGWAKREIVKVAESWGADLIVMGSHGYGAWDRFLLGSVSNSVATHAPCSVEIVRLRKDLAQKAA